MPAMRCNVGLLLLLCVRLRCFSCICICVIIGILMHIIFQFVCRIHMTAIRRDGKAVGISHCNSIFSLTFHFFFLLLLCLFSLMLYLVLSLFSFGGYILRRSVADMTWMLSRLLKHSSHISLNLLCANERYTVYDRNISKGKILGADGNVERLLFKSIESITARALFEFFFSIIIFDALQLNKNRIFKINNTNSNNNDANHLKRWCALMIST